MVAQPERMSPREHLDRRIAALDAEVEQIWAEEGDPAEALGVLLRERIGFEALAATYEEYVRNPSAFMFDDEPTDDDEGSDAGERA
jgi:hypothetical protein